MDKLLASFVRALRNAEVRVSTAETLDAMRAVELVGFRDRRLLKTSLSLALPKTAAEKALFDVCFDKFFTAGVVKELAVDRAFDEDDDGDESAPASESGTGSGSQGGSGASHSQKEVNESTFGTATGESPAQATSALGQLLMRGDRIEIGMAIAQAGEAANIQDIEVFTQKAVYARKIMNAMGLAELTAELELLHGSVAVPERRLGVELAQRRDWLRDRVRDYVEHQFLLHADVTGKRLQEELLRTVRLSNIDRRHMRRMQELIERIAKRLVSIYSRRRRIFRRGLLHVPQTIRRNVAYDGAIFDLRWRSVKVDRPKVFVLCDVSGSVADYAKFMLMLLYSLAEVLPKIRSFAFSASLAEVSQYFSELSVEDAIARILHLHGGGSTDYGRAFAEFSDRCLGDVDKRATVIVLGDARNNYGDARSELLRTVYGRCKRLIWLNPEPRSGWNLGDSEMQRYGAYCHQVAECRSLVHLERTVSLLLRSA